EEKALFLHRLQAFLPAAERPAEVPADAYREHFPEPRHRVLQATFDRAATIPTESFLYPAVRAAHRTERSMSRGGTADHTHWGFRNAAPAARSRTCNRQSAGR